MATTCELKTQMIKGLIFAKLANGQEPPLRCCAIRSRGFDALPARHPAGNRPGRAASATRRPAVGPATRCGRGSTASRGTRPRPRDSVAGRWTSLRRVRSATCELTTAVGYRNSLVYRRHSEAQIRALLQGGPATHNQHRRCQTGYYLM